MNLLSKLSPAKGSKHSTKRLGRGRGSGLGQTAGKGHKGQLARSGGKVRRGFEGGQSPLTRRTPKYGFSNVSFETKYSVVNVSQLAKLSGVIDPTVMKQKGLIHSFPVKVLGNGKIDKALTVKAHKFSQAAVKLIEAAGGKVEVQK